MTDSSATAAPGATATPPAARRESRSLLVRRMRELALVPALILLVVFGAIINPEFLTRTNLISILSASAALALVVLGEALILITGKIDLSLESTVGIAPAVGALLILPAKYSGFGLGWPTPVGILAIVVVGAVIGLFNGFLAVRLRLNSFMMSLAMLIVLRGLLVGAVKGKTLFNMPDAFLALATNTFLTIPVSVWLAVILFGAAGLVLRYHRWGRALYAIGGNAEAARAAGIRVERVTWVVYVIGSALAALGGLAQTGYVGALNANQGQNMIFMVMAAAVIGGLSLDGGRGTMFGALTGVLLIGVVNNLLTLAHVSSFWIQAIQGAIILVALMLAKLTTGKSQD